MIRTNETGRVYGTDGYLVNHKKNEKKKSQASLKFQKQVTHTKT